jgi:alanine racemase
VDVTELPAPVRPGDEAVLLGAQGSAHITAKELAEKANTIPWHIFTGIGERVQRVYINAGWV